MPDQVPQEEPTVSSTEVPWLVLVMRADPELEYERHDELFYDFSRSGHRARNFYGDPTSSGPYDGNS